MRCSDFHDLWQRRLDGEVRDISLDAVEHLRSCPSCSALERAAVRLAPALRQLAPQPVPPALSGRIVAAVLQDRRRRLGRQRWRSRLSLAAAACLLFVLGSVLTRRSPEAALSSTPATASTRHGAPLPGTVDESVQEMGEVVASLTSRTADATMAQTRLLLPPVPQRGLGEMTVTASLEPSAQSLREAGESISAGLAPVRQSARRALELFLRELPMENTKTKDS